MMTIKQTSQGMGERRSHCVLTQPGVPALESSQGSKAAWVITATLSSAAEIKDASEDTALH